MEREASFFMIGMLLWKSPEKRGRAVSLGERSILHTRFLCAEITRSPRTPEALLRRRTAAALRKLRRQNVTRVVLPEGCPWPELSAKGGVHPVSTLPLRRAVAADWTRWALAEAGISPPGARVAVCAPSLTGEVARTVTELALRHRYVLLDLPYGGEELARQLRRDYGVSLLLGPWQPGEAEAAVLFAPREGSGLRIPLYDEAAPLPPLGLPPALEEQLPAGADRGQLLSALREAGALRPGQISVGT